MRNSLRLAFAILIIVFSASIPAFSQELSVSAIPEGLVRGVNSVIRSHSRTYTIPDDNKMVIRETMCLTIMNEKALSQAHLSINYREGE
ncbi:MAG: hypothetical protein HGA37_16040, partial [Lentimicrobium sp.]|nr:hypothetical protein [Lentimicrobium sp.]